MPELSLERQFLKDVAKGMFHDRQQLKGNQLKGRIRSQKKGMWQVTTLTACARSPLTKAEQDDHLCMGLSLLPSHLGIGAS